jgi:spore maturation protein CgeB
MNKGLNIAFFGSSLVSAYWNGAATYYRGIIRELNNRGHNIVFYEPDAYDRQKYRDIEDPPYARSVVYKADFAGVRSALHQAKGADVIIKASGVGVFDSLLEQEVLGFQNTNTLVVFWDVDAPATLDRIRNDENDPFRSLIGSYDLILTYGGGDRVVNDYRQFGARQCIPVYNALDSITHFQVCSDSRFEGSLGFLGNRLPDREQRVKEFFFKPASLLSHKLFILGGNGWQTDTSDLPNIRYMGHVFTYDHNAFNSSVLAVLNINRQSMACYGFSPPTRIFEAAGAAACIITDAWEGIEMFLQPQEECFVARNGNEVVEILKSLNYSTARKIGKAAQERVLSEHTYYKRAEVIEKILMSCRSHQEVAS